MRGAFERYLGIDYSGAETPIASLKGFPGAQPVGKGYGKDADAMLSQPATKVFFKPSEPRAAKWISDAIGEIEVERLKESRSM